MSLYKLKKCQIVFRIGKHRFHGYDLIGLLHITTGMSKTELKRLYMDGAIDCWIDQILAPKQK